MDLMINIFLGLSIAGFIGGIIGKGVSTNIRKPKLHRFFNLLMAVSVVILLVCAVLIRVV